MKRYACFDYESSSEDGIKSPSPTTTIIPSSPQQSTASNYCSNQAIKRLRTCSNRIGNYIIGPKLNGFNYGTYLCRKDDTKDFFILKVNKNV
jgi:hypothetical protein